MHKLDGIIAKFTIRGVTSPVAATRRAERRKPSESYAGNSVG